MGGPVILIAPDKFKGTLTGAEAALAMRVGVLRALPDADVRMLPMADGGEGTVDAAVADGGVARVDTVTGPLGAPVEATWALLGDTAVIEMAAASGLPLVAPTPATALAADTAGTGQLISRALDAGAARIVIGVGGSASTDGGAGALRALGARMLDAAGVDLPPGGGALVDLDRIDLSALDPRLRGVELTLCTDVANPLTGPSGAAVVFGPQKGADPAAVSELDAGLGRYAAALRVATGTDLVALGWGGAGGGIAGGLHAGLGARAASGVDVVADILGLDAALHGADLVLTGEGSIDEQSAMGKTPVGVARRAAAAGIPVLAIGGATTLAPDALAGDGIAAITATTQFVADPTEALADPAHWVAVATEHAVRAFASRIGARPGTLPGDGTPYFHFLRTARARWWKPIAAVAMLVAGYLLVSNVLGGAALLVEVGLGTIDLDSLQAGAIPLTPLLLLATNVSLAAMIPIAMLTQWAVFRQRPRWLHSVAGGVRWRLLARFALALSPFWLIALLVLLFGSGVPPAIGPTTIAFVIIVLLTTPLQAAGEEYAARGLAHRATASWFADRRVAFVVGAVLSNLLFMSAHAAGDPWLNGYYFLFGVALAVTAWRTGGLEAPLLMHAGNNMVVFLSGAFTGGFDEGIDRSAGAGGPFVIIPLAALAVQLLVVEVIVRRTGVSRTGPVIRG